MVSVEMYVGDETFPRKYWVLHDSHVLVNVLYPWGCGSFLKQLGEGGQREGRGQTHGEKGVSIMVRIQPWIEYSKGAVYQPLAGRGGGGALELQSNSEEATVRG